MDYHSAIKEEILPFAITGMNIEGIVPSGINQVEKDKYCILSHVIYKGAEFTETETRMVVTRD